MLWKLPQRKSKPPLVADMQPAEFNLPPPLGELAVTTTTLSSANLPRSGHPVQAVHQSLSLGDFFLVVWHPVSSCLPCHNINTLQPLPRLSPLRPCACVPPSSVPCSAPLSVHLLLLLQNIICTGKTKKTIKQLQDRQRSLPPHPTLSPSYPSPSQPDEPPSHTSLIDPSIPTISRPPSALFPSLGFPPSP